MGSSCLAHRLCESTARSSIPLLTCGRGRLHHLHSHPAHAATSPTLHVLKAHPCPACLLTWPVPSGPTTCFKFLGAVSVPTSLVSAYMLASAGRKARASSTVRARLHDEFAMIEAGRNAASVRGCYAQIWAQRKGQLAQKQAEF